MAAMLVYICVFAMTGTLVAAWGFRRPVVSRNPCLRYRCWNGGTCYAPADRPVCLCREGYTGLHCENGIQTCPEGETFNACGSRCEPTCEDRVYPLPCPAICDPGCYCVPGLIRNAEGRCVPESLCDEIENDYSGDVNNLDDSSGDDDFIRGFTCSPGEVFKTCGSHCSEDTCSNYGIPRPCPRNCEVGCFCAPGLVRNVDADLCVNPTDCPPTVTTPSALCGFGEIFKTCGSECAEDTCSNYGTPRICPAVCDLPGCYCDDGFARNDDGFCVLPSDCPVSPPAPTTADPCDPVNCVVDPCQFAFCGAFPEAVCRSNYCRGCNPEFYIGNELVDCGSVV